MSGHDGSLIEVDGPWTHRQVSAGGTRFHVAEAGEGPLVLLLHGFPGFWWSWHDQLVSLPAAGYRAVAVDLRGYGGSDKPPRGYDLVTLAGDAAGLVRALGEANAIVVGHDWGGLLAWTTAVYHPKIVQRLAVVSAPHPLRLRQAIAGDPRGQGWAARHTFGFQVPLWPERWLVRDDAALVGRLLHEWSGPGWPDERTEQLLRKAVQIPGAAHSALEYHRWLIRSQARPDGIRYAHRMRAPIQVPTLQLHGALDTCTLPASARGSGRYVSAPYRWKLIEGAGHFPHQERPRAFDAQFLRWLADPEPDRRLRAYGGAMRDRDESGRPRNARPRDAYGRPLPHGATGIPTMPDDLDMPPGEALQEAQRLLDADRPFHAHEVLEAVWKAAPEPERELWRGLAQIAVGITHLRRGNARGAEALLSRAADRLVPYETDAPHGINVRGVVQRARDLAASPENGPVTLRLTP